MSPQVSPQNPEQPEETTVHGLLYKWAAEIVEGLYKKGEKLNAEDIALVLYNKVRKTTHRWRMQMLEVLAQDGAHQICMSVLRKWGPAREATQKQIEEALEAKEKEGMEEEQEEKQQSLFKWGDVELSAEEDRIVSELDKYGLRGVRTKAGYVLIIKATPQQLREAIALRAAQIRTMQVENDLLERLAQLRESH